MAGFVVASPSVVALIASAIRYGMTPWRHRVVEGRGVEEQMVQVVESQYCGGDASMWSHEIRFQRHISSTSMPIQIIPLSSPDILSTSNTLPLLSSHLSSHLSSPMPHPCLSLVNLQNNPANQRPHQIANHPPALKTKRILQPISPAHQPTP